VSRDLYTGSIDHVDVDFDQPTTGRYSIENANSLPASAPDPGGRTVGAVSVEVPDDVADRPATVQITVSRDRLNPGERPSDLRVVHFDEESPDLDTLDSTVDESSPDSITVSAETPGFSVFAIVVGDPTETPSSTMTATVEPQTTTEPVTESATAEATTGTHSPSAPSPTDAETPTRTPRATTSGGAPGFGVVVTLAVLLAGALVVLRRSDGR
jgi:PGF-CTERM protein